MGPLDLAFSEQFAAWERRGRGWDLYPHPVAPEPPFRPFPGFALPPPRPDADDGRRPGFLASIFDRIEKRLNASAAPTPDQIEEYEDIVTEIDGRGGLVELQLALPPNLDAKRDAFGRFLSQTAACSEPLSFEIVGSGSGISVQFAATPKDSRMLEKNLQAYFPEIVARPPEKSLSEAWEEAEEASVIIEFGLDREFLLPLSLDAGIDPFVGLAAAMSDLREGELALLQVLFQKARHRWDAHAWRAVTDGHGKAIFVNRPDFLIHAKRKFSSPLYGAVVRLAAKAGTHSRVYDLARELGCALTIFADREGNALVPVSNDGYTLPDHEEDLLKRQSRRCGMILNADEIAGFVRFPSPSVRTPLLRRHAERTKAAPSIVLSRGSVVLGTNRHLGKAASVSLTSEQRCRHMHVIGASGSGKSTLLSHMIRQDIEAGEGLAVLDPHGDLIDQAMEIVPADRIEDVVFIDPTDDEHAVGFNILSARGSVEKTLLASDLAEVFRRLSETWGDQMGSVLKNAILAFLESDRGGTLSDLRRFLIEPGFREDFLRTVRDPEVLYYWQKGFSQLPGSKSVGSVITRLNDFLMSKPIRRMLSLRTKGLDFAEIMDSGKILLARLPKGQIGEANAFLLGSLIVAKIQQAAMARQAQQAAQRRPFWLYVDEFHNFITPSMAQILAEARKYRLGLILAHQDLHQLSVDKEVGSAVLSHPFARVVFRAGDADAKALEGGFSFFEARDIQNLKTFQAICRAGTADSDFNLAVDPPRNPEPKAAEQTRQAVVAASRRKYSVRISEIEAISPQPEPGETVPQPPEQTPPAPAPQLKSRKVPEASAKVPKSEPPLAAASDAPIESAAAQDTDETDSIHEEIKKRIASEAESLDYTVSIEKFLEGTNRRADVALRRGDLSVACEVSVTTPPEYETENLLKCLHAGFGHVASICRDKRKLAKIQQEFAKVATPEQASKVAFYRPEDFLAKLFEWASEDPDGGAAERQKPRKQSISLQAGRLNEEERVRKERSMLESLTRRMRGTDKT